jgi:hypothetical protein
MNKDKLKHTTETMKTINAENTKIMMEILRKMMISNTSSHMGLKNTTMSAS